MKINKPFVILLSFLFVSTCIMKAQPLKDADNAFRNFQYEKALDEYKKGIKKIRNNQIEMKRVTFQIAECYRILGDLKRAEQQYIRLEKKNYQKDNPMILFHLGNIYASRGEYDVALKYYDLFKKREPEDKRIDALIESCTKAKAWTETPTRYEVENMKKFNTKFNDWAPRWGNPDKMNQIIFSSNREGSVGKGTDQWTGSAFSDLYKSDKPASKNTEWPGEWSPVLPLDETDIVNTRVNEGEASANKKGTSIYFTRCPQEKKKVQGCYIYTATKKGKSWGEPELLVLGPDSFNYVHPFVTTDELTIYFASNMPGGQGGYDIYSATRSKKSRAFENIKNLGNVVNTAGQEVFPALRGDTLLYFSSDGHPGMGALDIFVAHKKGNEYQTPENLMSPINSSWDDIGIIFDEAEVIDPKSKSPYVEKGFFSSNRPGGRGGDDIYYFVLRPLVYTIAGFVKDSATLQYIDGVTVELTGSDGSSFKTVTDIKGYYHFDKSKILNNTTYTLKVNKDKYWERNNTATQTTVGLTENTDLKQDFVLSPIPEAPIVLPDILYDFDSWELKPQYKDSLMVLYNIMIKNPTLVVELRSHTDFRGDDAYNEVLSQKRAQSCVDFLVNEKKIDADRIIPKGYGEYRPRKLEKDIAFKSLYDNKVYTFYKGTELTEAFINALPTKGEQEAAHQLNRRTEFLVLRTDYVPKGDKIDSVARRTSVVVVQKRTVPVTIEGDVVKGSCIANNKTFAFEIAQNSSEIYMSYTEATRFLKEMIITVSDFEEKEKAIKADDGSIIENAALYLQDFKIGEDFAENVRVIVKKGLKSQFVIGSEFISDEFGSYIIDKDKKMIVFDK